MNKLALLGSKTDHGGTVISASSIVTSNGQGVARVGDKHSCPLPNHGTTPITNGSSVTTADGIPVALIGSKTGCGATIVESISTTSSD